MFYFIVLTKSNPSTVSKCRHFCCQQFQHATIVIAPSPISGSAKSKLKIEIVYMI